MKTQIITNDEILSAGITKLSMMEQSTNLYVSAFIDMSNGRVVASEAFQSWVIVTRRTLPVTQHEAFESAVEIVTKELVLCESKSLAVYVSLDCGEQHAYALQVPLKMEFYAEPYPVIFPLVKLRDQFERFILVLTTSREARILEVDLGETSTELVAERPGRSDRSGREFTKEHYQSHRQERGKKFVREKVAILDALVAEADCNGIIIAGEARYTSRLKESLPKHLAALVIDEVKSGVRDARKAEILELAIDRQLEFERKQSDSSVAQLVKRFKTTSLAKFGFESVIAAMELGQADDLIISTTMPMNERETLVRVASQQGLEIETVGDSELLEAMGSCGVSLRYHIPPVTGVKKGAA